MIPDAYQGEQYMQRSKPLFRWLLFSLPLTFLVLFYFYPLLKIVLLSFFPDGSWNPGRLSSLVHSPIYGRILWFTCWQAALSTLLTLALALPGAYIFARYRFFGKNLLQALMTVPFVLPTVVTAAAFRALLGTNGLLNNWLMAGFDLAQPPISIDQTVGFFPSCPCLLQLHPGRADRRQFLGRTQSRSAGGSNNAWRLALADLCAGSPCRC